MLFRSQWHNHDTAQRPRVMLRRRDGETCPVDLTLLSLRDASGQVVRRVLMGRDVSDAIRLEAEQEQARALLREHRDDPEQAELAALASEELDSLQARIAELTQRLIVALLPRDPRDDRSVMLEIWLRSRDAARYPSQTPSTGPARLKNWRNASTTRVHDWNSPLQIGRAHV